MRNYQNCKTTLPLLVAMVFAGVAAFADVNGPSPGIRYATDAYPGFDMDEEVLSPERKTPGWFSWWSGPKMGDAAAQLEYARACVSNESWRAARKSYDALVREWPTSAEAPIAQRELADLYFEHYAEYASAFKEYKYLMDYYSSQCGYNEVAVLLYKSAKLMREEGKRIIFFRFANTMEVRRAFEAVVLRVPGADFVPDAMMTVAQLREDEEQFENAALVYENIRHLFTGSEVALDALVREGRVRMKILGDHEYNRSRCQDTIDFFKMALASTSDSGVRDEFRGYLNKAVELIEEEAYKAAKFYDSRTRTKRSAINAYERYLMEHPASRYAEQVQERLAELKETEEGK